MKRFKKAIIILESEPMEAFNDIKTFCEAKGLKYNTYIQKKLPFEYNGSMVVKVKRADIRDCVFYNGQLIPIL